MYDLFELLDKAEEENKSSIETSPETVTEQSSNNNQAAATIKVITDNADNNQSESSKKALSIIEAFFKENELDRAQDNLRNMTKIALTNEEDETSALERSNMIFFYESLKELMAGAHLLVLQKEGDTDPATSNQTQTVWTYIIIPRQL